jgi:hypothetical protein
VPLLSVRINCVPGLAPADGLETGVLADPMAGLEDNEAAGVEAAGVATPELAETGVKAPEVAPAEVPTEPGVDTPKDADPALSTEDGEATGVEAPGMGEPEIKTPDIEAPGTPAPETVPLGIEATVGGMLALATAVPGAVPELAAPEGRALEPAPPGAVGLMLAAPDTEAPDTAEPIVAGAVPAAEIEPPGTP